MADWSEEIWRDIKAEFMTQGTSFRKLAEKYGPNKDTIWKRAKEEDWDRQRRRYSDEVQTKMLESDTAQKISMAEKLNEATQMLLVKTEAMLRSVDTEEMNTTALRDLSVVLKNAKEILMIKSKKDMDEQDARIAKLRKEADMDQDDNRPKLVIEGLPEEFRI